MGARPKTSDVTQSQAVSIILTTSTNTRPTAIQQKQGKQDTVNGKTVTLG